MKLIDIENGKAAILFTKSELYMLRMAIGGPVFKGTKNRDIPVLKDWNKQDALNFESRIETLYQKVQSGNKESNSFSFKELNYLIQIHYDHMIEIDPIEYPIIIGYDYKKAEDLLSSLEAVYLDVTKQLASVRLIEHSMFKVDLINLIKDNSYYGEYHSQAKEIRESLEYVEDEDLEDEYIVADIISHIFVRDFDIEPSNREEFYSSVEILAADIYKMINPTFTEAN